MASERGAVQLVAGIWYPPLSSRGNGARLAIDCGGVVSAEQADGRMLAEATLASVEVSPRVGSIPRRVSFPDGSVFETDDNDGVDALLRQHGRRAGLLHDLERFHPRLIVFAAVVLALAAAIYRYFVPALVELAIAVTPPVVPRLLSQSAMISLDQTILSESTLDPGTEREIGEGFSALAALAPRGTAGYRLHFRDGGVIGPNAFALPDGTVVMTDQLVRMAGEDREAILAVLAHEIGHVEREHSLRQLYRAAGIGGLVLLIGGDLGGGAEDVLVQGAALASLSYSRGQETEADRFSVELMHEAGRDPAALARFFQKLRDELHDDSRSDFLSTHPSTPERIEETLRYAEEIAADGR